jgi:predicted RNase H-like nuclease
MRIRGIDGCKGGWVCLDFDTGTGDFSARVVPTFDEVVKLGPDLDLAAIDIPIGIPDRGARECDRRARRFLGARGCCVFPVPIRAALEAATWIEACDTHARMDGRRVTKQAWAIVKKILEVDRAMRECQDLQDKFREVHPEVSFALWRDGRPMSSSKKSRQGRLERELIIDRWMPGFRDRAVEMLPRDDCARDDVNDAFAALWSAGRFHQGQAVCLPETREMDGHGLPMQIMA